MTQEPSILLTAGKGVVPDTSTISVEATHIQLPPSITLTDEQFQGLSDLNQDLYIKLGNPHELVITHKFMYA